MKQLGVTSADQGGGKRRGVIAKAENERSPGREFRAGPELPWCGGPVARPNKTVSGNSYLAS